MSLKINNQRRILVGFRGGSGTHSTALVNGAWTSISATFSYSSSLSPSTDSYSNCHLTVGTTSISLADVATNTPLTFNSASDIVRIGGSPSFMGDLSSINIFSPRTFPSICKTSFSFYLLFCIVSVCAGPGCQLSFGFSAARTCMWPTCSADQYSVGSRCERKMLN